MSLLLPNTTLVQAHTFLCQWLLGALEPVLLLFYLLLRPVLVPFVFRLCILPIRLLLRLTSYTMVWQGRMMSAWGT